MCWAAPFFRYTCLKYHQSIKYRQVYKYAIILWNFEYQFQLRERMWWTCRSVVPSVRNNSRMGQGRKCDAAAAPGHKKNVAIQYNCTHFPWRNESIQKQLLQGFQSATLYLFISRVITHLVTSFLHAYIRLMTFLMIPPPLNAYKKYKINTVFPTPKQRFLLNINIGAHIVCSMWYFVDFWHVSAS